jgi:hypothetical protein
MLAQGEKMRKKELLAKNRSSDKKFFEVSYVWGTYMCDTSGYGIRWVGGPCIAKFDLIGTAKFLTKPFCSRTSAYMQGCRYAGYGIRWVGGPCISKFDLIGRCVT